MKYLFTREELIEAAKRFPTDEYSELFYQENLKTMKKSVDYKELKQAIEYLFYWKLGKIKTHPTKTSKLTIYKRKKFYIIFGTPAPNRLAIQRTTEDNFIKKGLEYRRGMIEYSTFRDSAQSITKQSIVLPIFLIHIWRTDKNPILDVNVWRVFKEHFKEKIPKKSKPKTWSDFEQYKGWFNQLVTDFEIDRRIADKGLWVMGLSNTFYL